MRRARVDRRVGSEWALRAVWLLTFLLAGCNRTADAADGAFQGVVELTETDLSFEVPGRVVTLDVREGDEVTKGQALARLDDSLERPVRDSRAEEAAAARFQSALVVAGARKEDVRALAARIRAAKATEDTLGKDLARARALVGRGAAPPSVSEDLEGQVARAEAERQSLEANLVAMQRGARDEERDIASSRQRAAEAALGLEDAKLARYGLVSPVAGRVLDVHVELGEVVGQGAPVVTLGDVRRPFVDVFIPQAALGGVTVGARANVRVDASKGSFAGTVEHIARRTEFTPRYIFSTRERSNLVVRVRVRVEDPQAQLHAGVPAFVTMAQGSAAP